MSRRVARTPKAYVDGVTDVCDWELEEALLKGRSLFGLLGILRTQADWRRAWDQWGAVILPKALEHRPGLRPFALYAIGEIEPRELRMPLPFAHGWAMLGIPDDHGNVTNHYLNVPEPFIEHEAKYLHRLGIVSAAEMKRHRAWMQSHSPTGDRCPVDGYVLEMGLFV